jgi:hypothetical protein
VPFEVFCTILFVDYVSRESIDIKKIVPLTILSGFLWSSSVEVDIFYFGTYANGSTSILTRPGMFALVFNLLSVYWSLIVFYLMVRLYWEASPKMRTYSKWNLISSIIIIIRGIFFYEIDDFLPGLTFLMMTVSVLQQMVHKGAIHEIHMEQGIVLLQRIPQSPYVFLLVTTKVSKILRNALLKFSVLFVQHFPPNYDEVINIQQFASAKEFLTQCFPFVPE